MAELIDFSIETDTVILLRFRDGSSRRVNRSEVARYVSRADEIRIKNAYLTRAKFLKDNMPRAGILLLFGLSAGMLAVLAFRSDAIVAGIWLRPNSATSPRLVRGLVGATGSAVTAPPAGARPLEAIKVALSQTKARVADRMNQVDPSNISTPRPVPTHTVTLTPLPSSVTDTMSSLPLSPATGITQSLSLPSTVIETQPPTSPQPSPSDMVPTPSPSAGP